MKKTALSEKEKVFCLMVAEGAPPREAAAVSGLSSSGLGAEGLLLRKEIKECIKKFLPGGRDVYAETAAGLRHLATGSCADAVRLLIALSAGTADSLTKKELDRMDLSCISEIKLSKGGAEIKFYDRMLALSQAVELEKERSSERAAPLYKALMGGARAVSSEIKRYGRFAEDEDNGELNGDYPGGERDSERYGETKEFLPCDDLSGDEPGSAGDNGQDSAGEVEMIENRNILKGESGVNVEE